MLVLNVQTFDSALVFRINTTLHLMIGKRSFWIIIYQFWLLNIKEVVGCDVLVVLKDLSNCKFELMIVIIGDLKIHRWCIVFHEYLERSMG